jgi:hypothetical protein
MTIRGNALTTHQVPMDPQEKQMSGSIVFRTSSVAYSKEQVLKRVERANQSITTVVRFKEPVSDEEQALMHELFSSSDEEESAMVEESVIYEESATDDTTVEPSSPMRSRGQPPPGWSPVKSEQEVDYQHMEGLSPRSLGVVPDNTATSETGPKRSRSGESVEAPIDADAAAQAKHQAILAAIERLRVDAAHAMAGGEFAPHAVVEAPSKEMKQAIATTKKKGKLVRDYLLLGTQYGDVHGDHEPVRRDWFRAVYVSADGAVITDANRLWSTPDTSKTALRANADWQKANAGTHVEVSDTAVRVHYVDRLKPTKADVPESHAGANAVNITEHAPQLAQMLRDWQPHAASAQPGVDHPLVVFEMENGTWGKGYSATAYGKAVTRAWGPLVSTYGAPAPVKPERKGAWGETGCTGARHVTKRARRGVKNEEQDKENASAAARQMHTAATDRKY